jgi:hypothetical protein
VLNGHGMKHGVLLFAVLAAAAIACGSGDDGSGGGAGGAAPGATAGDDGGATGTFSGDGGASTSFGTKTLASIEVSPAGASIESMDGAPVTQALSVIAHYADGTSGPITTGVTWTAGLPQVGAIAPDGTYTASGSIGGAVPIAAKYQGQSAQATLTVKLHLHEGLGALAPGAQGALQGANAKDPNVTLAYPYDGTVFPRGLAAPPLMWNGGSATDTVFVHVVSPTFELESYAAAPAPNASFTFAPATWQRLVDSIGGKATLSLARWDGTNAATVIALHTWTIAPASMRGTIYYWAQNIGRVVRIKPGASAPDDFANAPPLNDPAQYPSSSCLMTCHTVSADGSTIVSGGGTYGGSYSLKNAQPMHSLGGVWGGGANGGTDDAQNIQWSNAALSPDGAYVVENYFASQLSTAIGGPAIGGMYKTSDGSAVAASGLPNEPIFFPAFSPDASKLVYVGSSPFASGTSWLTVGAPGPLRVLDFDATKSPMLANERDLVQPGTDPNYQNILWPTVAPDGHWAVYSRSNGVVIDSRGNCGSTCDYSNRADLYIADTTKANAETRLAALDGDSYPFAAGARDLHYNYEPTFAPVAAGGYFWVVFTSRRTYGNKLTGTPATSKQLWVAAIDQNPQPGVDPSHPAFHLPGQDETTLNLRGFWALDPCKGDGQGCGSGTECCGGYCDATGDASGPVCKSQPSGCSSDGDKCNVDGDCCGAATGTTCINHVCSEGAPK